MIGLNKNRLKGSTSSGPNLHHRGPPKKAQGLRNGPSGAQLDTQPAQIEPTGSAGGGMLGTLGVPVGACWAHRECRSGVYGCFLPLPPAPPTSCWLVAVNYITSSYHHIVLSSDHQIIISSYHIITSYYVIASTHICYILCIDKH